MLLAVLPELKWALQIGSGLSWTFCYLFIIKRGFSVKAVKNEE